MISEMSTSIERLLNMDSILDSQALVITFSYVFVMSWIRKARFQDRVQISRQKSEESHSVQEYFIHNYEEIINILVVSQTPNSQNCTPSI